MRNLGAAEATFRLGAADGYYTENGRFTTLPAGTESTAAGAWIDLPEDVRVAAGETVVIPFEITDSGAGDAGRSRGGGLRVRGLDG